VKSTEVRLYPDINRHGVGGIIYDSSTQIFRITSLSQEENYLELPTQQGSSIVLLGLDDCSLLPEDDRLAAESSVTDLLEGPLPKQSFLQSLLSKFFKDESIPNAPRNLLRDEIRTMSFAPKYGLEALAGNFKQNIGPENGITGTMVVVSRKTSGELLLSMIEDPQLTEPCLSIYGRTNIGEDERVEPMPGYQTVALGRRESLLLALFPRDYASQYFSQGISELVEGNRNVAEYFTDPENYNSVPNLFDYIPKDLGGMGLFITVRK
jgi:hypothetical protein